MRVKIKSDYQYVYVSGVTLGSNTNLHNVSYVSLEVSSGERLPNPVGKLASSMLQHHELKLMKRLRPWRF